MGNVPISCCRSKSPRLNHESRAGQSNINAQYSSSNSHEQRRKLSSKSSKHGDCSGELYHASSPSYIQQRASNILQHISEREPDDSETDPSLNALNRPIFAARSSCSKNHNNCNKLMSNYCTDTHSSDNSNSFRKQFTNTNAPLTSSQDQGYNSCASTNLTNFDGNLTNSSFESSSIQRNSQQQVLANKSDQLDGINQISTTGDTSSSDNRLLRLNSPNNSDNIYSDHRPLPSVFDRYYLSHNEQIIGGEEKQKASSCSTIFIDDSTISQPNLDQTIKCVSLAIYYHIKNRTSDNTCEIFDESIHPLRMPTSPTINQQQFKLTMDVNQHQQDELIILDSQNGDSTQRLDEPDQKTIYNFVRTLFKAAQLTSEYAITTLVYLERLMTYAEMDLTPKTWRRMFLGAILLSSKVWEDQAVWNVDYAQILEEISVDDINELERQFLELIQFNMNVPSSVYAKYYFHLRTLALKNGLSERQTLLTIGKARDLEVSYCPLVLRVIFLTIII